MAIYTADMDSLACAIAYTELLNLEGKDATTYIPEELNSSVTEEVRSLGFKQEKEPKPEYINS